MFPEQNTYSLCHARGKGLISFPGGDKVNGRDIISLFPLVGSYENKVQCGFGT